MCVSCYGKTGYSIIKETVENHYPIVSDRRHVHREMLKTFAYFASADGEGILVRGFMENEAGDFDLLYLRDSSAAFNVGSATATEFGWRNLSFMSQVKLPGGTVKSFPTVVYEIVGDAGGEREAAERWFGHINKELIHFTGDHEDFANLFRPYSQAPYKEKLEVAAEEARRLLSDRRQFLDSADTIATFAEDMSEFLKTSELTQTRAFVHSFAKEIEVKPGKAAIVYSIPTPEDSPIGGADAAEIALTGRVRSSVRDGGPGWT